jgi:hypothetical protein
VFTKTRQANRLQLLSRAGSAESESIAGSLRRLN